MSEEQIKKDQMTLDIEQRISELEAQLAYQDDHIQKLNDAMVDQQKRIDALEIGIRHYEKRLQEIQEGVAGGDEGASSDAEVPPHY